MAERRRRKPSSIFKKSRKENRNKEIAEVIGIVQMMRDKNIFVKVEEGDDVFVRMD